ncbi:MAG TPA: NB-ARC domain-containing protein [Ktedonobacteraceae bacterium]|nr:NB-ARC domain-containing protein [Ktedonobacteraceae bacterium]
MVRKVQATPNERLKQERLLHGWSQADLAGQVGTDGYTVNRWERGRATPGPYFRQKLCDLFGKNAEELGFLKECSGSAEYSFPTIWNIPYRRNTFFTGRESVLEHLHTVLKGSKTAMLSQAVVLSGPGGAGKTQTAVEYAYRYHDHYEAVLWMQAESNTMLLSSFMNLAKLLDLPQKNEQDQNRIVAAVKSWLKEHANWLLLLDNAEDLEIVSDFLPTVYTGHVLLTARTQSTGTMGQRVEIEMMDSEEGTLLLLRRAKYILTDEPLDAGMEADRVVAMELSHVMDGLPLALDQAGAYIDETECGLTGYLKRYRTWRSKLLRRRGSSSDHPEPVSTTWSLIFDKK